MNFWQVVAHQAMTVCIDMAAENGLGSVGIYDRTQIDRVAEYAEILLRGEQGMRTQKVATNAGIGIEVDEPIW